MSSTLSKQAFARVIALIDYTISLKTLIQNLLLISFTFVAFIDFIPAMIPLINLRLEGINIYAQKMSQRDFLSPYFNKERRQSFLLAQFLH